MWKYKNTHPQKVLLFVNGTLTSISPGEIFESNSKLYYSCLKEIYPELESKSKVGRPKKNGDTKT